MSICRYILSTLDGIYWSIGMGFSLAIQANTKDPMAWASLPGNRGREWGLPLEMGRSFSGTKRTELSQVGADQGQYGTSREGWSVFGGFGSGVRAGLVALQVLFAGLGPEAEQQHSRHQGCGEKALHG